jgi:hypothetical protein
MSINEHELEEGLRIRVKIQRMATTHYCLVRLVCHCFSTPAQPKVSIRHQSWIDGAIMAEKIFLIANSTLLCKGSIEHGNYKQEFVASRRQIATTGHLMSSL